MSLAARAGKEPQVGDGRPSFVKAALATYGTNLTVAVLGLANVLIIARSLGAAGRGDVALLITIGTISSFLAAFGIQEANANIAGQEPERRRSLATNSLLLALLLGGATAGLVGGLIAAFPAVGGEVEPALLPVSLVIIAVLLVRTYLMFLVQADYHFGITNLAWVVSPVTSVILNLTLALAGVLSVATAIGAWALGQLVAAGVLVVHVARRVGFGRPDWQLARRSLLFGAQTHLGRFMGVGTYRIDQWFVGAIAGSRELGRYSVAVAWAEILYYVSGVLVMIQRPDLVRATQEEAVRLGARVQRVAVIIALPLAVGLIVVAPLLCVTLFGDEFGGSVDDLRVLALGVVGIVTLDLLGSALNAQRRPMLASAGSGVAFATTIALDILLIPHLGGLGAAIATAAAYTAGGVAAALIFTRALGGRLVDLVPQMSDLRWLHGLVRSRVTGASNPGSPRS
jgi:O-antigen/teichoic acid export membrane protein